MTVKELEAKFNKGLFDGFYIFSGNNQYLINDTICRVEKSLELCETDVFKRYNEKVSFSEVENFLLAPSFFSANRLLILFQTDFLNVLNEKDLRIFSNISPGICFIVVSNEIKSIKNKKVSAFLKSCNVIEFRNSTKVQSRKLIKSEFELNDKFVSDKDIDCFLEASGGLEGAMSQMPALINYPSNCLNCDILMEFSFDIREYNCFKIIEYLLKKDSSHFYLEWSSIKSNEEVFALLSQILWYLSKVNVINNLQKEGIDKEETNDLLSGVRSFVVAQLFSWSRNFSGDLNSLIRKGLELQFDIRNGTYSEFRELVEAFIFSVLISV